VVRERYHAGRIVQLGLQLNRWAPWQVRDRAVVDCRRRRACLELRPATTRICRHRS